MQIKSMSDFLYKYLPLFYVRRMEACHHPNAYITQRNIWRVIKWCPDCCQRSVEESDATRNAEANAHIPTSEIEQDIRDTEREIAQMEEEAKHLEATPLSMTSARVDHMRASSRWSGIEQRKEFVEKL